MITTIYVSTNSVLSEKKIKAKYFPTTKGEHQAEPFLINVHTTNSDAIKDILQLGTLQWSTVYNQPDIRVLYPTLEHWNVESFLKNFETYGLNRLATYICKFREICGNALFFKVKDDMPISLSMEEFVKIKEDAKLKLGTSDEERKFSSDGKQSSQEERQANWDQFVDKMFTKNSFITLEMIHFFLFPGLNSHYIKRNLGYYNSFPSYCICDDIRGAYIMISFEHGCDVPEDVDYLHPKADKFQPYRPENYDQQTTKMTETYQKLGLTYVKTLESDQEIATRLEKEKKVREGRISHIKKITKKNKKQ